MPRRDGTGPVGRGLLTGRGMGVCAGSGAGRGLGLGLGLGFRRGFGGPVATAGVEAEMSKDALAEQKKALESRLEAINKALEKL